MITCQCMNTQNIIFLSDQKAVNPGEGRTMNECKSTMLSKLKPMHEAAYRLIALVRMSIKANLQRQKGTVIGWSWAWNRIGIRG